MPHITTRPSLTLVLAAAVFSAASTAHAQAHYFAIAVQESTTGDPIPCATLRLTNSALYTSDSNGIAAVYEPGLMGQEVWFSVEAQGYSFPADGFGNVGKRFTLTEGGSGVVQGSLTGTPPACSAGTDDTTLVAGPVPPPGEHFRIEVIDAETGRGVPVIEVRSPERSYWTDNAGLVAFYDPDLMDQAVSFAVDGHGYDLLEPSGSVELVTTRGAIAQVLVAREPGQIAERLYRITGAGGYRDSVLLGETPPTAFPNLNGLVMGQDSVLSTIYQGQLFWIWGDTSKPSYPLGNFKASGAISLLPGEGGLDPAVGVDLEYFVDGTGFSKAMAPSFSVPNPPGVTGFLPAWLGGLTTAPDASGTERLFARYDLMQGFTALESGILVFNDDLEIFVKVLPFDGSEPATPGGQPVNVAVGGLERVQYGPGATMRVARTEAALLDTAQYEAFTPLAQGSTTVVVRDPQGAPVYGWKTGTAQVTQAMLDGGLALAPAEALFGHVTEPTTGAAVLEHSGSVAWNPWRGRYTRILLQAWGATSLIGEIWYQEADTPMGPWVYARKVATHDGYSFYNPRQHDYFAEDGGRRIFFEATYTAWLGSQPPTPRHNYNQVMNRLDLEDERLALPLPVYDLAEEEPGAFAMRPQLRPWMADRPAAFFAQDRPGPGSVPVHWTGACANRVLAAGGEPVTEPVFWALPPEAPGPPPDAVELREYRNASTEERAYSVDPALSLPGFELQPDPVALVWQNPMPAVTLPVSDHLTGLVTDAGPDQCTVEDAPGAGATVLLLALASSGGPEGFTGFEWSFEGGSASGAAVFVTLPLGVHDIELDTTAADGTTGHDRVIVQVAEHATTVCNDGLDNDGDGLVDFPDDLGCTNGGDESEQNPTLACDDGVDNDGDGLTDYPDDPGCSTNIGNREDPECDDGVDNDGDGKIDWDGAGADPECIDKPWRNSEAGEGCGLGGEAALLLPGLWRLRRRRAASARTE